MYTNCHKQHEKKVQRDRLGILGKINGETITEDQLKELKKE